MSVERPGSNVPAVISPIVEFAAPVVEKLAPFANGVDKVFDAAIDIKFEKPTNDKLSTRLGYAGMSFVYAAGACGHLIPFTGIVSDLFVAGAGAAATAVGSKLGNEEIANHGRLATQTGIAATGATAAGWGLGFADFFTWGLASLPARLVNVTAYARAAIKEGKAAIKGTHE